MPAKRSSSAAAVEEQQSTAKPQQPAAEQQQQQQQQEKYRLTGGDIVVLRPRIFVTVEGRGQIMELARDCWTRFHTEVVDHLKGKTEGMWAAADANEAKTGDGLQSYRAGAVVACLPEDLAALPACATVSNTSGGYYLKFTMRGDYDNLGEAWGVAVERASHTPGVERDLAREGLENYLNSPMHMDGLPDFFTDIYIPIKETAPEFSISSGRVVEWTTPRRFAYIEAKRGFAKIADALFGRMHGELMPKIGWENVTCSFGLSLDHYVEADGTPAGTYRVAVQLKPNFELPAEVAGEVQVAEVAGRFLCFGMVGDYANIPTAWQHIMGAVERDSSVTMDKAVRPLIEEFTATPFAPLGTTKCVTQFFVPIAS